MGGGGGFVVTGGGGVRGVGVRGGGVLLGGCLRGGVAVGLRGCCGLGGGGGGAGDYALSPTKPVSSETAYLIVNVTVAKGNVEKSTKQPRPHRAGSVEKKSVDVETKQKTQL